MNGFSSTIIRKYASFICLSAESGAEDMPAATSPVSDESASVTDGGGGGGGGEEAPTAAATSPTDASTASSSSSSSGGSQRFCVACTMADALPRIHAMLVRPSKVRFLSYLKQLYFNALANMFYTEWSNLFNREKKNYQVSEI